MNPFSIADLNGYAQEMGFESERERIEMFLSVPQWHEDALWTWLDEDGTKAGLEKILNTKRPFPKRR
jgi:hypothetical protein